MLGWMANGSPTRRTEPGSESCFSASSWQGISKQPIGKFLREPVDGESSLMDYLVRQQLDTVKVTDLMNLIHAQIDQKVRSKRARSVGMVAKQSGFKPLSSAQEDESFDRVTKL